MAGEAQILRDFMAAFGVAPAEVRAMREVVRLTCDTTIFLDPLHPWNLGRFRLGVEAKTK